MSDTILEERITQLEQELAFRRNIGIPVWMRFSRPDVIQSVTIRVTYDEAKDLIYEMENPTIEMQELMDHRGFERKHKLVLVADAYILREVQSRQAGEEGQ